MKSVFLLSALAFATALPATPLPAAITVSGRIVDAELLLPLEYATVSALNESGTLVDGTSTDSLGRWQLVLPRSAGSGQASGEYTLRFAFIGYTDLDTTLSLKQDVNLGDIKLRINAVALDAATVTATRSQLSLKLDKQIFEVGADLVSQGGTANEVLDNVPMVQVSPEGVVSLRGNASVTVLINGKPSALADNNALQSIPAANILRVEVITTPSSRYEAAGSGGIINIITRGAIETARGGQVSASVGIPADYRLNGSFTATQPVRAGSDQTITYFGNGGLRLSNYFSTGSSDRTSRLPTGTQTLREDLDQERQDRAWNGFGGVEWRPSGKTTLSASYSFYHQTNDDFSDVTYRFTDGDGKTTQLLQQAYDYLEPENYHQIEVAYTQDLKEGQQFRLLFQNDFWDNNEQEAQRFVTVLPLRPCSGQAPCAPDRRLDTRSLESSNDYLIQGDYEQKLRQHTKLELGFRAETRLISSDYLAEQTIGQSSEVLLGLENVVDYTERIGAAYAQWGYEKDDWGLQLGLRNEYTYVQVLSEDGAAPIEKRYNRLFPTATVSYQVTEGFGASLSYSRRVRRPGFWQLNPFGGLSNPNDIEFGNPDLDPSFPDIVELKLLYRNDKLTLNPFLLGSRVLGYFDTYVEQAADGTVFTLPINLDRELQYGGGMVMTYAIDDDWQLTAEGYLLRLEQRGVYEGVDFGNDFRTGNAQVSVRGKVWWDLRVQSRFDFVGGQRYRQSFRQSFVDLDLGVSKALLSDRLTVTLNVRNVGGLQVFRGGTETASFSNAYRRVWQQQRAQVTAAWDIGKDVRERRARGRIR